MDWRVRSVVQILLLGCCLLAAVECGTSEKRVVCYYTNWSVYRPGTAKFSPQNINPYLCTHLIYAFGGFTKDNTLKPFDKYQDIEKGGYAKFTGLKTYNKNLKTMLAVGGWNEGSSRFSPMVADPERRKQFVRNSIKFLRQNHFDGLDLDWEYPAFRDGGKPRDKDNYASLVQELREAYERESSKTGRPRLLLTMAVPAGIEYINKGYDIPKLNQYLDFINLLSYDYHSSFEPAVNHHSPLYPLEEDNEYNFDTELTVDFTIKHLLESGASPNKIVLGIPTYGRSYTLFNEDATDIGSPADGPGEEGDATREKGYLAYYEICESLIDSDEWEIVSPNSNAMGPYAFRGNQWVGYDDEAIVRLKAQYVNEQGLGGIMFWSIDNDDFRGKCHNRPYPLIEAAKESMLSDSKKSNNADKSRTRPSKTRTDSNFIGRKLGAGRRRTTEAPVSVVRENSRKRVNSRSKNRLNNRENSNDEEEETRVQHNGRNGGQFFGSEEDDDDSNNSNAVRSVEYNEETPRVENNRNQARSSQAKRRSSQNNRRRSTTASSLEDSAEQFVNVRVTTPAPPTTPDPGTDFKCEDEGFFSHPRDCKKYFWCLDAGPGGLGIVAHHFTCPAGLVFNKAADSCDYPRNVVCPKVKPVEVTTTQTPVIVSTSRSNVRRPVIEKVTESTIDDDEYEYYDDEEEEEDKPVTTTTARSLQYKTLTRSRSSTTTTTTTEAATTTTQTPKPVTSRSYQSIPSRGSSIPDISSIEESEEDPKVIQELIELIKKAGGIEELEKQLHLQGKGGEGTDSSTNKADVTPATISRSLYERVLNRQVNGATTLFRRTTLPPITTITTEISQQSEPETSTTQKSRPSFSNGPGRSQFEGLDDIPEVKSVRRGRPEYTTITRNRPVNRSPEEDSEEDISADSSDKESSEDELTNSPTEPAINNQKKIPGYFDIRSRRTSTTRPDVVAEENTKEVEESSVEERPRNQYPVQEESSGTTSKYVTIPRVRSTTEAIAETSQEAEQDITPSTTSQPIIEPSPTPVTSTQTPDSVSTDLTSLENADSSSSTTLLPITEKESVEESLAPTLTTVLDRSTTQESDSEEEQAAKGLEAVSQPKPFGFHRRTRPTTAITPSLESTTSTTTSVSSETGRVKVPTETVRLPTLKEIIGLNTIVVPHDYTTNTPITQSSKNSIDENAVYRNENNNDISETVIPPQIFVNKIQQEEENQSGDYNVNEISQLEKFSTATESPSPATIPIRILKQDKIPSKRRKVKLVNIPVRILQLDKPLTEVILEVPEHKLNSVLRSLLRVEIINEQNLTNSNQSNDNSQRNNNQNYGKINSNEDNEESNEIFDQAANSNLFTTTTPGVSTVRGSRIFRPATDRNRGFYVTKSIESNTLFETVTTPTTPTVNEALDNDSSTTTEQLTTITEASVTTTTSDYYENEEKEEEKLETEKIWPSIISTSLENLDDILDNNDDTFIVTQRTTVTPDNQTPSTQYFSTTETLDNVESTTEPNSTEYEEEYESGDSKEFIEPGSLTTTLGTTNPATESTEAIDNIKSTTETSSTEYNEEYGSYEDSEEITEPNFTSTTFSGTTNSATESSSSSSEPTGSTFYTESSSAPNYQSTTVSDYEESIDGTEFVSTQTSTTSFDNTVTHTQSTGFNTEPNSYTGTTNYQFISTTDGLDSTSTTASSAFNEDLLSTKFETETTTKYSTDSTTSDLSNDYVETTTKISTDSTIPYLSTDNLQITTDSTTTPISSTTITDVIETNDPTENNVQSTTASDNESTTESDNVITSTSYLVVTDSGSESTVSTSPNDFQITTAAKKEDFVYETAEIPIQASRALYPSPSFIPQRKTERRRIIKKRIHGIRRPYVETVNETETTIKPKGRYIRRRIINHSTGEIVDQILKRDSSSVFNNVTSNSDPEFFDKVKNNKSEIKNRNSNSKTILRHRAVFRRRKYPANSSIEANISSQNNSASNDVQSSSVSSTDSNQRRRIVVQRFRNRFSRPAVESTTINESSNILTTESTLVSKDERKTYSGQDYTDVTIDNLSSGSENFGKVSVQGREELSQTESIFEAMNSGGEINLFKTRTSSQRRPGTIVRPQTRSTSSTSVAEDEISTTSLPSTKLPNNIAIRRRFRQGQRSTTQATTTAVTQNPDDEILDNVDQTGHAQEVEVTVAVEEPSSPTPSVSTGRAPFRTAIRRRKITTAVPNEAKGEEETPSTRSTIVRQRQRKNPFDKISATGEGRPRRPAVIDYDYYEDSEERIVRRPKLDDRISYTDSGSIRCLDQGNFPHPTSCKKFITCSRMVNGQFVGTEYTCPRRLTYDPVGGICNWSAGLGCK